MKWTLPNAANCSVFMPSLFIPSLLCGLLAAMTSTTLAQSGSAEQSAEELSSKLMPLIQSHEGEVAVAVRHFTRDVAFDHNSDTPMPTASLIKFPLLAATYQEIEGGKVSLDDRITLEESDKVPGSGILTNHFSSGISLPLKDLLRLMIVYSDNTATNLVAEHIGIAKTSELMESLDCPETKLHSKTYSRKSSIFPERSQKYGLGSTTAADMVKLLGLMQSGKLVSENASLQMLKLMQDCDDNTKIAKFIPAGVKVANKSGEVSASRTDAALIDSKTGPIAICVLTTNNKDQRWGNDNPAHLLCANIGKVVYEHFNVEEETESDGPKVLAEGSNGLIVEALQRTLNARSNAGLAVDGDFGPATKSAVVTFQESKGLEANGIVDAVVWEKLGPLVAEEEVADPEVINSQPFERAPVESFDGLPFVTCKGWAIGDPASGEILFEQNSTTSLHPASTTKIMTGYVVAKLAEKNPEVLDEIITFSKRADDTSGSTAGVRVGEQVSVRELLYGLLLPSGNDASVAFGEHFGTRLAKEFELDVDGDSYDAFIAVMNHTAKKVGMVNTQYRNTHGLTHEEHLTTAADLFHLSREAMKIPFFSKVVATPIHGATLKGSEGYRRNVVWKNTNRLLKTEGYEGIKTGTTNAAGSCLVSQSTRSGRTLIVVVLGSAATDSRYADSRNLYGYAWQKLGLVDRQASFQVKPDEVGEELFTQRIKTITRRASSADRLSAMAGLLEGMGLDYQTTEFLQDGVDGKSMRGTNLTIRLGQESKPKILLGAHFDQFAVGRGVVDNAGSCAALLELAKRFKNEPLNHHGLEIVFFDLEESGLLGSKAYVKSLGKSEEIVGFLNLDIFGYGDAFWMMSQQSDSTFASSFVEACRDTDFPIEVSDLKHYPPSDHIPFAKAGIPTLALALIDRPEIDDVKAILDGNRSSIPPILQTIHTPNDQLGKIDAGECVHAIPIVEDAIRRFDSKANKANNLKKAG